MNQPMVRMGDAYLCTACAAEHCLLALTSTPRTSERELFRRLNFDSCPHNDGRYCRACSYAFRGWFDYMNSLLWLKGDKKDGRRANDFIIVMNEKFESLHRMQDAEKSGRIIQRQRRDRGFA